MSHPRQLIREAVQDALHDATAAENRVYKTRVLPLRRVELPAVAVYTLAEPVDAESVNTAPRELTRELEVTVEGWVSKVAGQEIDDTMDDLAEQIEIAMHADPYFGGTAGDSILSDTALEVVEEGGRMLGMVALTYQVTYRTFAPEPPATDSLDDFGSVGATIARPGDERTTELHFNLGATQ